MFTLFTIPKAFTNNQTNIAQRNAINSWKKITQCDEIFLIGKDEGVEAIAKEYKIKHLPNVKCNDFGTPYINSAFNLIKKNSKNNIVIYVNADIIFFSDLIYTVAKLPNDNFLAIGKRMDIDIENLIDFNNKNWEINLKEEIKKNGQLHGPSGIDYFIFNKKSFNDLPEFAVGRPGWDNWMIYDARKKGLQTIDLTKINKIVHQNHERLYDNKKSTQFIETTQNLKITQNQKFTLNINNANFELTDQGVVKKRIDLQTIKNIIKYIKDIPEILPGNKKFWKTISSVINKIT